MSKLFKIVVDTEQYSGNFEREMCAYVTGQIGECGVERDWAIAYSDSIKHIDWWEDHIVNRPDDREHPCYRPAAIYPTLGWSNNGSGKHSKISKDGKVKYPAYLSVAIFTNQIPPEAVLIEFAERAREFCAQCSILYEGLNKQNSLTKENIDFTGIRIIKGIKKEELISEIKFN